MKLSAITDSGSRLKDFVDIAFLSTKLSLKEMLEGYVYKYKNSNEISILKALNYYEDIKWNDIIHLTNGTFEWELIDKRLRDMD
jgi:hypothetical protein